MKEKTKTSVKKNSKKKKVSNTERQYLVITNFIDGTYQNDIFSINEEQTDDDIVRHRLEQYNQFTASDNSPEPRVKEITLFEITTVHNYKNLDISFNDIKKQFLESEQIKWEIAVE